MPRQLTALSFPFSTVLQTGRCAPASHAWRDSPPALLPLAPGDVRGGRSHCGPDHLCQEPSSQGRSHEETQVLLRGVGSWDVKPSSCSRLHSLPAEPASRPRRWKGLWQISERLPLKDSRSRHNRKTWNLTHCFPCVVAIAAGSSSELYGVTCFRKSYRSSFSSGK